MLARQRLRYLAVWGLAMAYRQIDAVMQTYHELSPASLLMRGLLFAMMRRRADKSRALKHSQLHQNALHAKYNTCRLVILLSAMTGTLSQLMPPRFAGKVAQITSFRLSTSSTQ